MGSINDSTRPFRWTHKQISYEHGLTKLLLFLLLWKPIIRPCIDAIKAALPLKALPYHPVAMTGLLLALGAYIASPWALVALCWACVVWAVLLPDSYLRRVHGRTQGFLAGFRYRHRVRQKLRGCSVLRETDPTPTISHIQKTGCITRMRIKMCYGHDINWWREDATRLAQTYNSLDCKINPYRREVLAPWRHEMVTKPRWLELEFLTRDPFTSKMGAEFVDYHRQPTLQPVVAVNRSGQPHHHNLAAHRLRIAMTRWGKSNAIRAMIYAQKDNIRDGILELWGIDGKGGVEQSLLQHAFARVAYGDHHYNEFDQLLRDAVTVMKRRQRKMRGFVTEHIPTPKEPWLLVVIDELLILTSKAIEPKLRSSIAANIMLIQQQGIACGVTLDASTQLAQKERIDFRDGFTEFELGKVERGAVDMIFGSGWWQMGVRADEIPDDLKGTFYIKTDATMSPEQNRYPEVPPSDVSKERLGFTVEKSALWSPPPNTLPRAEPPALTSVPDPEPVLQPAGRLTDL